ncbi:flagellar protein FlgN [Paenibacillus sepulcri]|uniref:Flagellar protein FlgN n=1 Tax=Paenibacillus sepulcri TaxID=359917 RepID=A0ABS7C053_9BACL|nr:flagellar protein FlgN [Paenibacillus sepulcri]
MSVEIIVETLEKQAELYALLLETAKLKTPVLVKNEVEQLNAIIQKERKLLVQAEKLELQRMQYSHSYFQSIGVIRYKGGKIIDIIRTITSPQEKKELTELHGKLTGLLDELQKVNKLNQELTMQSLKFIDYSIDLVIEDPNDSVTYQHPMNTGYGNQRNGFFDTRG